jgi:peptidoglycan hydrolase-like protein with peptidoglycan-binding domain
MTRITAAVGAARQNRPADVMTVQALLNRNMIFLTPLAPLEVDGRFGPATEEMIKVFQNRVLKMEPPDGIVSPNGPTLRALSSHAGPLAQDPTPHRRPSDSGVLTEAQFVEAARTLGCETAAVKAVVATELGVRKAFDSNGRPTILFERHYFSRLTGRKFDKSDPDISNPTPGGYGGFSEQYPKLERAKKLDKSAALQSASWGAFQIMGANYHRAGFASVDDFVRAMSASLQDQVDAFVTFIKNDSHLLNALRNRDWTMFAKTYNGPGYAANKYDTKMEQNYHQLVSRM